jgi:hypothetical protein
MAARRSTRKTDNEAEEKPLTHLENFKATAAARQAKKNGEPEAAPEGDES